MPTKERRHGFEVRDELDLLTTGHLKGAASISGTAGKITTFNATTGTITTLGTTTLTPTTVNATDVNVSGDLTRNSAMYISGTSATTIPSGYTRCTEDMLIIDEGIAILSGKSGSISAKLSTTPAIGKSLSLVYIDSGATKVARISGNFKIAKVEGPSLTEHYAIFHFPGDGLTVTGDGTYWYPTHPASGTCCPGPTWSDTIVGI